MCECAAHDKRFYFPFRCIYINEIFVISTKVNPCRKKKLFYILFIFLIAHITQWQCMIDSRQILYFAFAILCSENKRKMFINKWKNFTIRNEQPHCWLNWNHIFCLLFFRSNGIFGSRLWRSIRFIWFECRAAGSF